ncbi:MAG: beta-ketoacyl synthase [Flavobacteriales bacterium]|nr:beta-ketoacyl synthase [Flavobacteriales bacterium]
MKEVFISYGSIITPLGNSEEQIFQKMVAGESGIQTAVEVGNKNENIPLGKIRDLSSDNHYIELLNRTCDQLIDLYGDMAAEKSTKIIISSTKADIEVIPNDSFESTRKIIKSKLNNHGDPLIISNACISGILAINTAADYISHGLFDNAIVIGIDVLSDFVTFGFQSLYAISNEVTRPFDKSRKGINLGEAAGAVLLSKNNLGKTFTAKYLGGSSSNDANHISGPSRTGEGLFRSINKTLERSKVNTESIDFISGHGTGTIFNDEMESIAFDRLGMNSIPLNSMKGFFGHTLGAAGVIEVICSMKMMEHQILIKNIGIEEVGVSGKINILENNLKTEVRTILKTGSGFGGGNASLIIQSIT